MDSTDTLPGAGRTYLVFHSRLHRWAFSFLNIYGRGTFMWVTKVRGDVTNFDTVFGHSGFNFNFKFKWVVVGHISPAGFVH